MWVFEVRPRSSRKGWKAMECRRNCRAARSMPAAHAHAEDDQVDDEQEDDRRFEDQHPAVVLLGPEELVEVVEGLELFVDRVVPVGEVEAGADALVDAGEVPVAEE